nr:hypothetical protein [uncultured Sphingomonas sp.]
MTLHVKNGGSWATATPHVKDGSTWKPVLEVWVKDGATWKQSFTAAQFSPPPGSYDDSKVDQAASLTITSLIGAVYWTWTRTGTGTGSPTSGLSGTSFTATVTPGAAAGSARSGIFTVNARTGSAAGPIIGTWTLSLSAESSGGGA